MEYFEKVGRLSDFAPGVLEPRRIGGVDIVVVNVNGRIHALSNFCPHEGITLTGGYGMAVDDFIVCMMHSSLFEVETGEVFAGPAETGLTKYEVKIESDDVLVSTELDAT